ncbi:MAG: hypothetical protein AB8G99_02285 [Planctomycetaceae bacterium]
MAEPLRTVPNPTARTTYVGQILNVPYKQFSVRLKNEEAWLAGGKRG